MMQIVRLVLTNLSALFRSGEEGTLHKHLLMTLASEIDLD